MAQTTDLNHANPLLRLVAKVRNAVGQPHIIFEDDAYISDLELTGNSVLKAAAMRLIAIANSEAYIQKVQKTLELETDGKLLSDSYRASAKMLLSMVETAVVVSPVETANVPTGQSITPRRVDGYSRQCQ